MPRPVLVGGALLLALLGTAGLLTLLSPHPLVPDAAGRLFAVEADAPLTGTDTGALFAPLYETSTPIEPGRWTAIHLRHSRTPSGNASTLAEDAREWGLAGPPDHFVIGNGEGAGDGEIQFTPRWDEQHPAHLPQDGAGLAPGCISICLIGDFDRSRPTEAQMLRLRQLLADLQQRLDVPPSAVLVTPQPRSSVGVGARFPMNQLFQAPGR